MSRNFPEQVQLSKATSSALQVTGEVSVDALPRLQGLIATQNAGRRIVFTLQFGVDTESWPVVEVSVAGPLVLLCQRSLAPFDYALAAKSTVVLVASEEEADKVPEHLEPMICEGGVVPVLALVEEEILLALPLRPVSPGSVPIEAPANAGKLAGLGQQLKDAKASKKAPKK